MRDNENMKYSFILQDSLIRLQILENQGMKHISASAKMMLKQDIM